MVKATVFKAAEQAALIGDLVKNKEETVIGLVVDLNEEEDFIQIVVLASTSDSVHVADLQTYLSNELSLFRGIIHLAS